MKRSDRSEAGCTPEMPANLWAPASEEGEHGGLLGPTVKVFHIVLPAIYGSLSLSATSTSLTYDKCDLATPYECEYFWTIITFLTSDLVSLLLLVISIWFFHCSLKPRTAFMRFISRLDRAGKKCIGGQIMREEEESSRRLWALMGSRASIHSLPREFGWPRARIHGSQIYFFFCPCLDWSSLWLGDSNQYLQLAFDSICLLSGSEVYRQ